MIYATPDGRQPFAEWLEAMADERGYATVAVRLARVRLGNMGDCRFIGEGLSELRIHFGPGYRVYFGEDGQEIVLLLCGGTKRTQQRDIARARMCWRDYRSRENA
jgi:putative addiction module killer protein